jgi:hypothetical protein
MVQEILQSGSGLVSRVPNVRGPTCTSSLAKFENWKKYPIRYTGKTMQCCKPCNVPEMETAVRGQEPFGTDDAGGAA